MSELKKLPVGVEDFKEILEEKFYYIDKTGMIEDLFKNWAKINLFTRPRRFGKTLNMSMLQCFFEIGGDKTLFDGLKISKNKVLCDAHMGKYPVIFLSLKGVDGLTYEAALYRLKELIGKEAERFWFLLESDQLTENEKNRYRSIIDLENGKYAMDEKVLISSIQMLSELLFIHYGQKTIILIDEYDVPLDKAFNHGYYREMTALIRGLFGQALKTNMYLQFAVLTGCLRVSKESIFTGLNNFDVNSIVDVAHDEYFGFTETEVIELLKYYGVESKKELVKEWYDGYRFGNADIYCPWDVIKYAKKLLFEPDAEPEAFWINTSGNDLVKRFVDKADKTTQNEIERLIAGECIEKSVRMDLTYDEIDSSIDHLWSVLFTTGYLTQDGKIGDRGFRLRIPNREVREVFVLQIKEWFEKTVQSDSERINRFCAAFPSGDAATIQDMLNDYLWDSISVRDTAVKSRMKENFYHGLLLGLLRSQGSWLIQSNAETGEGYSDISVSTSARVGIVIELKYAEDGNLENACDRALKQIEEKKYAQGLMRQGMKTIISYGIAFYGKMCMVEMGE